MLTLSAAVTLEKNKLSSLHPFLTLLEIYLTDGTTLRLVDNTEDVTWPAVGGNVYQRFPFELEAAQTTSKGEIGSIAVKVGNVTRTMQGYLEQGKGGIGATVTLRVVHANHLDLTTPEIEEVYDVIAAQADSAWCTITLGAPNPLVQRFPRHRYLRDHCRWVFKSTECAYAGEDASCARTLAACRAKSNTVRFGGFPGIPGSGIYVV